MKRDYNRKRLDENSPLVKAYLAVLKEMFCGSPSNTSIVLRNYLADLEDCFGIDSNPIRALDDLISSAQMLRRDLVKALSELAEKDSKVRRGTYKSVDGHTCWVSELRTDGPRNTFWWWTVKDVGMCAWSLDGNDTEGCHELDLDLSTWAKPC